MSLDAPFLLRQERFRTSRCFLRTILGAALAVTILTLPLSCICLPTLAQSYELSAMFADSSQENMDEIRFSVVVDDEIVAETQWLRITSAALSEMAEFTGSQPQCRPSISTYPTPPAADVVIVAFRRAGTVAEVRVAVEPTAVTDLGMARLGISLGSLPIHLSDEV